MAELGEYREFFDKIRIPIRLACKSKSGWPVLLSLWFIYFDGFLYCATRGGARVVGYLRENEECAFEVAADQPPYCGVRGQARSQYRHRTRCRNPGIAAGSLSGRTG